MFERPISGILRAVGAIRRGHFVYTSGLHGDTYIDKRAIYHYKTAVAKLCEEMASRFADTNIEVVIGPEQGAITLANQVSRLLSKEHRHVAVVHAKKDGNGGFRIQPTDIPFVRGKRVLIVEDVITTGSSLKKVVEVTRVVGGEMIGAISIVNRGKVRASDVGDIPILHHLLWLELEAYPPETCQLCRRGIPINTDVGHGKEFLARKNS